MTTCRWPPNRNSTRLDELFGQLKKARDRRYASTVAESIWSEWYRSGSATVDLMMTWSNEAFERKEIQCRARFSRSGDHPRAGFRRRLEPPRDRALLDGQFRQVDDRHRKTLELEPRHFGALAGMATILERTGRKEAALKAWERALTVYPAMQSAQEAVIRLSDELAADPV
jgi:tetratricopeptide (TPR) repeat protein